MAQRQVGDPSGGAGTSSVTPSIVDKAQYALQYDDVGSGVSYLGQALPGTSTASALWRVKKIVATGPDVVITFADGNSNFDNIWANRLGLAYS